MIANNILATIEGDAAVEDVWIGLHWTVVTLTDGRSGMASTLSEPHGEHGKPTLDAAGKLHKRSARTLAAYADGHSGPAASVAWAAINALTCNMLDPTEYAEVKLDALDYLLAHGAGKHVAIIGHFPFTAHLRAGVGALSVLELAPRPGDLPATAAPEVLPRADVVAITSLTLVNGTFESLTQHLRPGARVMMLGPTTPLSPVLFAQGVDVLSGVRIVERAALRQTVMQGATFRQVRGVQKVTITCR